MTWLQKQITRPITNGRLVLGTWQGIYLGDHCDHGGERSLIVTLDGEAPGHFGGHSA